MKKIPAIIIIFAIILIVGFFYADNIFKSKKSEIKISENIHVENNSKENKSEESETEPASIATPARNASQIEAGGQSVAGGENKAVENDDNETDATNKTNEASGLKIINKLVSWGFEKKDSRTIDTIIVHSSYDALGNNPYDVDGLIKEYKQYGVSPHYLIDRKGVIYRLVIDKNVAYHAGVGKTPDGRNSVNNFSIGIELMNTKTDKYTDDQYASLKLLIANLKKEYKIKYVLGHNQIAPGRKDDPWNFDFKKL